MLENVTIKPMTEDFVLWRCLHGGPLDVEAIDAPDPHPKVDWAVHNAINLPLLSKLTQTYGTCAMLAWDGNQVVGYVRFYPKVISAMPEAGHMCLQQVFPNGPSPQLIEAEFAPLGEIQDKTLAVHCLMTGSPQQTENPYQRKGLGTRLVRAMVDWATENGWDAIEATAYVDLPLFYEVTGNAGRHWWERLGFEVVSADEEPAMDDEDGFVRAAKEQAAEQGLDPESVKTRYTMRLELRV